jgi:hypothetical protein
MKLQVPADLSPAARAMLEDLQIELIVGPAIVVCHPDKPLRIVEGSTLVPIDIRKALEEHFAEIRRRAANVYIED